MRDLGTVVARTPSDAELESGPMVAVVPMSPGQGIERLYRQSLGTPMVCPSGEAVMAIVSSGVLNSPDQLEATAAQVGSDSFAVRLDIRRHEGPMAANDPWVALVGVELGALGAGTYTLTVKRAVRPSLGSNPAGTDKVAELTEHTFSFECT